jgi:hypothetical protein
MHELGRLVLAGTLALGGLGGAAFAHEHAEEGQSKNTVTIDQLPAAARSTFEKEARGGNIEELRSEKSAGKTIYKGEVVSDGKGTELKVSEDGTLLKRSKPHDEASERDEK